MNYIITYVSTARPDISEEEVKTIMQNTEKFNNAKGINGLLLFSEGNFLQVIEGEKEEILKLWERIQVDRNHYNVIRIFDKIVAARTFQGYKCDFITDYYGPGKTELTDYLRFIKEFDRSSKAVVENLIRAFIANKHGISA